MCDRPAACWLESVQLGLHTGVQEELEAACVQVPDLPAFTVD